MYATLGNIEFKGLYTPVSIGDNTSEKYAIIPMATGKPTIQRIGSELKEVSLVVRLHTQWCTIQDELDNISLAMENATVMPFVTGSGDFIGNFLIIGRRLSRETTDANGAIIDCNVDLQLLEYNTADLEQNLVDQSAKAAFANDTGKAVQIATIAPKPLPNAVVSLNARGSVGANNAAKEAASKAVVNPAESVGQLFRAKQQIEKAKTKVDTVISTLQNNVALLNKAPEMLLAAQNALAFIPAILTTIASGNPTAVNADLSALGDLLTVMVTKGIAIENELLNRK